MARAVLSVSVDFDLALQVQEEARRRDKNESFVVAQALRSYFDRAKSRKGPVKPELAEAGTEA